VPVGVVIVVIPIPLGMPTMRIFVPPSVTLVPAALPRLVQFMPPSLCLLTRASVVFNGFMQIMVGPFDSPLAILRAERWCAH
jgi:hypothetical protein